MLTVQKLKIVDFWALGFIFLILINVCFFLTSSYLQFLLLLIIFSYAYSTLSFLINNLSETKLILLRKDLENFYIQFIGLLKKKIKVLRFIKSSSKLVQNLAERVWLQHDLTYQYVDKSFTKRYYSLNLIRKTYYRTFNDTYFNCNQKGDFVWRTQKEPKELTDEEFRKMFLDLLKLA